MRRIKKAKIQFVSLVPKGANKIPVLYKADGTVEFETLLKASEDAGEVTAIVYAAEHRDSQGDIASAEVIREMAHGFQKAGGQVDIRHDGKPVGIEKAYVAETFIVQKGDPRFVGLKDRDGKAVDATGAWATVLKIDDPELRRLYKSGEWEGVSMAGLAEVVETEKEDTDAAKDVSWLVKTLRALWPATREEESMKKEDIEALKGMFAEVLKETLAGLKPAAKADDAPPAPAPKADPAPEADAVKKAEEARDAEIAALKEKLAKLQKNSNQDAPNDEPLAQLEGFAKEDVDAIKRGQAIAEFINKGRA